MKTIHPAIAEHAMEENERLRGLLRDVRILLAGSSYKISGTAAFLHSIDEALSHQAEPTCSDERPCVSCFSDDGACLAEPAPAQDEREAFEVAHALRALAEQFKEAWPEHDGKYDFLVGAGSRIARATRPAQTEQQATVKDCLTVQPMAYAVFAANGNAVCFSTRRDHPSLVALEKEGHSVVSLAPIAQTAPQPEQSGLVEELFDGYAVYQEVVRHRREAGLPVRTSAENVSDALDAVVRLIKARRAAIPTQGDKP